MKAIASHKPAAIFEMTNGARFWWMLDAEQVRIDRMSESFSYEQIRRVTLLDSVDFGLKEWKCELGPLADELHAIKGLSVRVDRDISFQPALPENRALVLELSVESS